jgi:cell division protein FtsB
MPNRELKRLEEANARVLARVSVSRDEASGQSSGQQKQHAVPERRSSRGGLALGLIGSLLAAHFGVVVFWLSPYDDATKQIVARWEPPTAAPMSPELMQRLEMMTRDLTNVSQEIEQLRQMTRDNATVTLQLNATLSQITAAAEQLKAELSQIARANAAMAEQLKASQEQTVRPRARPKPIKILPQVERQPEPLIRR